MNELEFEQERLSGERTWEWVIGEGMTSGWLRTDLVAENRTCLLWNCHFAYSCGSSSWRDLWLTGSNRVSLTCLRILLMCLRRERLKRVWMMVSPGMKHCTSSTLTVEACCGKPYSRVAWCRREVSYWSRLPGWVLRRLYFLFELHRFLLSCIGCSLCCRRRERPTKSHGSPCCLQFHQDDAFICDSSQCNWSEVGESVPEALGQSSCWQLELWTRRADMFCSQRGRRSASMC